MSDADGYATATVSVSSTCEDNDCEEPAAVAMIVKGELGTDGIVSYCDSCAEDRDGSDYHTAIAEVTQQ